MYKKPILFLIFKRPEITMRVFNEIRKQKPQQLFIAADGGRNLEEHKNCELTRNSILNMINWECDVKTLFRDTNLGCRKAVNSAITWFFNHVNDGVIIEEDCLPDASFFTFCEELLERYMDDTRIMTISGNNFLDNTINHVTDYYYSSIMHCWGWASWKRAWELNDFKMENYQKFKDQGILDNIFADKNISKFWISFCDQVYNNTLSTWDCVWCYSILSNNGLNIHPRVNLVSNIGFDINSTHCKNPDDVKSKLPISNIKIEKHPEFMVVDKKADEYDYYYNMGVHKDLPILKYMLRHPLFLFKKNFWNTYLK